MKIFHSIACIFVAILLTIDAIGIFNGILPANWFIGAMFLCLVADSLINMVTYENKPPKAKVFDVVIKFKDGDSITAVTSSSFNDLPKGKSVDDIVSAELTAVDDGEDDFRE